MTLIPWPYKAAAALVALALYTAGVWHQAGKSARLDCLEKENKALTQAIADNAKANDERREAEKRADKLAALPPKVVTVVRNNPSNCTLPRPVTDSVRDQVRQTNSAIRSVR